jgi:hypothetical protein
VRSPSSHEYADYGAWQMLPPSEEVNRFRTLVMQSWRDAGGEPDIGRHLPEWLAEEGFEMLEARPLMDVVGRQDFVWQWPAAFMATNAARLAELDYIGEEEVTRLGTALDRVPTHAVMVTPLVLEIIARRV